MADGNEAPPSVSSLLDRFEQLSNPGHSPLPAPRRPKSSGSSSRSTSPARSASQGFIKKAPPIPESRPFRVDRVPSRSPSPSSATSNVVSDAATPPATLSAASAETQQVTPTKLPPPVPIHSRPTGSRRTSSDRLDRLPPPLPARQATLAVPMVYSHGVLTAPSSPVLPPPSRTPSPASQSNSPLHGAALPPPPQRITRPASRSEPPRPRFNKSAEADSDSDEPEDPKLPVDAFPDASTANRRPPEFRIKCEIKTTMSFTSLAVLGHVVAIGCAHHVKVFDLNSQSFVKAVPTSHETSRVTAVAFKFVPAAEEPGKRVWAGTKEGQLFELDLDTAQTIAHRPVAHAAPLTFIGCIRNTMITLDSTGKLNLWVDADLKSGPTKTLRLTDAGGRAFVIGSQLWTTGASSAKSGSPTIRVYEPTDGTNPLVSKITDSGFIQPGAVTGGTRIPLKSDVVYLSHETGHVSMWDRATAQFLSVTRISLANITCIRGVGTFLWAGFRSGLMQVYDPQCTPWKVVKSWKAHSDAIIDILIDIAALWTMSKVAVVTSSTDGSIRVWNGFLGNDYVDHQLMLREAEYCTYRPIKMLICSWNVAAVTPNHLAADPTNQAFLSDLLLSVESPDVIMFGFQEIIDLENKGLAAKSFLLGRKKTTDGKLSEQVSHQYQRWRDKLAQAVLLSLPANTPYSLLQADVLVGLFTCVFVKNSLKPALRDPAMALVKTGFSGRFGNKGAIMARFVVDDSSICLINCHLAAGMRHVRQRNQDLADILAAKEIFPKAADLTPNAYAGGGGGEMVYDHDMVFLQGDLNYRIDGKRDQVIKLSEAGDLAPLIEQDQLKKQIKTAPGFRLQTYNEAPLSFAPTYKYDKNSHQYDSSDKGRIPAWCDRILWRAEAPRVVKHLHYQRYECTASDHRPISAAFELQVKRINSEKRAAVLQQIEAEWTAKEHALLAAYQQHYKTL